MDESVGETGKHDALLKLADRLESEAWELMAAFLLPQSGDADFRTGATESEDIVGETDGD